MAAWHNLCATWPPRWHIAHVEVALLAPILCHLIHAEVAYGTGRGFSLAQLVRELALWYIQGWHIQRWQLGTICAQLGLPRWHMAHAEVAEAEVAGWRGTICARRVILGCARSCHQCTCNKSVPSLAPSLQCSRPI